MKACVDQDLCIGCGLCAGLVPDVFQMNDEGKAEAYQEAGAELADGVSQAIDMCPVGAISEVE